MGYLPYQLVQDFFHFAYCQWLNPTPVDRQFKLTYSIILYIEQMCISQVMQNMSTSSGMDVWQQIARGLNTTVFYIFCQEHCAWNPLWGIDHFGQ